MPVVYSSTTAMRIAAGRRGEFKCGGKVSAAASIDATCCSSMITGMT